MLAKPIEEAVEGLIDLGVLSEEGLIRVGRLFAAVKALKEAGGSEEAVTIVEHAPESAADPAEAAKREPQDEPATPHEPDPEFTDDPLGLKKLQPPTTLKVIPGFAKGYSPENLEREPEPPKKRKPRGSFHVTPEDLTALRRSKTIKQIAIDYGGLCLNCREPPAPVRPDPRVNRHRLLIACGYTNSTNSYVE